MIRELQERIGDWKDKNFPEETSFKSFAVVVEEVGELAHAMVKCVECRYDPTTSINMMRDAVGDIVFALLGLCDKLKIDAESTISDVCESVLKRDYIKYPKDGRNA